MEMLQNGPLSPMAPSFMLENRNKKRRNEDCEDEGYINPAKRSAIMCKLDKSTCSQLLEMSAHKLAKIRDAESHLLRCVLLSNFVKRLKTEMDIPQSSWNNMVVDAMRTHRQVISNVHSENIWYNDSGVTPLCKDNDETMHSSSLKDFVSTLELRNSANCSEAYPVAATVGSGSSMESNHVACDICSNEVCKGMSDLGIKEENAFLQPESNNNSVVLVPPRVTSLDSLMLSPANMTEQCRASESVVSDDYRQNLHSCTNYGNGCRDLSCFAGSCRALGFSGDLGSSMNLQSSLFSFSSVSSSSALVNKFELGDFMELTSDFYMSLDASSFSSLDGSHSLSPNHRSTVSSALEPHQHTSYLEMLLSSPLSTNGIAF